MLHGRGIAVPIEGDASPLPAFAAIATCAADAALAQRLAIERVLAEWTGEGNFARVNRGAVPALVVEECVPIGGFRGWLARKPSGYVFHGGDP